ALTHHRRELIRLGADVRLKPRTELVKERHEFNELPEVVVRQFPVRFNHGLPSDARKTSQPVCRTSPSHAESPRLHAPLRFPCPISPLSRIRPRIKTLAR